MASRLVAVAGVALMVMDARQSRVVVEIHSENFTGLLATKSPTWKTPKTKSRHVVDGRLGRRCCFGGVRLEVGL